MHLLCKTRYLLFYVKVTIVKINMAKNLNMYKKKLQWMASLFCNLCSPLTIFRKQYIIVTKLFPSTANRECAGCRRLGATHDSEEWEGRGVC